ncbi:MAG: hypothetical protein JOZ72_02460 [Alphaproteobacteria bacterium]|nr:hypothetical protein [Alphaproteobacteria bacterium]
MALCRLGWGSDVYVYYDVKGGICCCRCPLSDGASLLLQTEREMIAHLRLHRDAGHEVPEDAIAELEEGRPLEID